MAQGERRVHWVRRAVVIGLVVVAGGCATSSTTVVVGDGVPVNDGALAPFPECQTNDYAFVGRSSLAAIGLGALTGGDDASRVGDIWVTAGPVAFAGEPPLGAPAPPPQRVVCIQFADGSGMSTTIDDGWQPPAGAGGALVPAEPAGSVPMPAIAVAVALVVLGGVSYLAFRRDPA